MDLVIEDDSRVDTVYFMMDEDDVKQNIALAVGQLRLRRRRPTRPKGRFCSRSRTRAPTATSPGCWASTCATKSRFRWRKRSAS